MKQDAGNSADFKIDVIKIITKDSLRGIGQNYKSLPPDKTVIAGNTIKSISEALNFKSYKIGRISTNNAFVAYDTEDIFYLYVNPKYKNSVSAQQPMLRPRHKANAPPHSLLLPTLPQSVWPRHHPFSKCHLAYYHYLLSRRSSTTIQRWATGQVARPINIYSSPGFSNGRALQSINRGQ